jgi:hypothetical protein
MSNSAERLLASSGSGYAGCVRPGLIDAGIGPTENEPMSDAEKEPIVSNDRSLRRAEPVGGLNVQKMHEWIRRARLRYPLTSFVCADGRSP